MSFLCFPRHFSEDRHSGLRATSTLQPHITPMITTSSIRWISWNHAHNTKEKSATAINKTKTPNVNLRYTNVLLSVFALLLAFLVEGVDDLYTLTPGLNKLIGLVSLVCIVVAVLLTHTIVGKRQSNTWQLWQPFIGGWKFVTMQCVSWTLLSISLLITGMSLHPAHLRRGTYTVAGTLAFLSEVLMTLSIPLFESPTAPANKTPSIHLRWNDVGTINIIIAALTLLAAVFMDHLRDLTLYVAQIHNILIVVSVLCIVNAAVLTHIFVGKMRHGSSWRSWNPFFEGGWRFAALQAVSWVMLCAAVLVGAWSLRYTAMEGMMTLSGSLGFLSVLLMVISIHNYVVPVVTETVITTPPSKFTPFQKWLLTVVRFGETVRRFLVISFFFNIFYTPLAFLLPAALPFIFTPVWIGATIICLFFASYATASYLPRPEVTGAWDSNLRESFIVRDIVNYFSGDVVKTAEIDPAKQYIYGFHPHGILPMASMWAHNSDSWKKRFNTPKRGAVTLIATHLFRIPFTRDILAASGAREVSRIAFETALKQGKSVFLVPGGMKEMQYSTSLKDEIKICTKHKGFIRMALKEGIDLVPVYSFGETKLLDGAFPKLQTWCWKHIKMPFPLFYGRWGMPIPRPQPITVVVGAPISVKKTPEPTPEQIDEVAKVYFEALRVIFENHKASYGHASSTIAFD